jgi:hypothetical protein
MSMIKVIGKQMGRMRGLTLSRRGESIRGQLSGAPLWVILLLTLFSANLFAAQELTFDVLQTGAQTYKNVTVTSKAKSYIFIKHSAGLASIKVSELSNDALQKLGYITAPKPQTNSAALWARKAVEKMDTSRLKNFEANLLQKWGGSKFISKLHPSAANPGLIVVGMVIMLAAYLFYCYCCRLVCQKVGTEPGALVWLPLLKVFPMLRAASMPAWWFVALFIPGVNLLGYVVWCSKIVEARGKTALLLVLLLLPVFNVFAFLYLAFSEGATDKTAPAEPKLELMTLEIA